MSNCDGCNCAEHFANARIGMCIALAISFIFGMLIAGVTAYNITTVLHTPVKQEKKE